MFAQKVAQQSMRRLVQAQPGALARVGLSKAVLSPASIASSNQFTQMRLAATTTVKGDEYYKILEQQRMQRPVAPHLSIYRPQITWILSSTNRITGLILSGTLYIFSAAYLVAPLTGWHLESTSVAATIAAWPLAAKVGLKTFYALPFTFHCFNGVRHLIWDTGKELSNKSVVRTGWTVVGLSVTSALYLALFA